MLDLSQVVFVNCVSAFCGFFISLAFCKSCLSAVSGPLRSSQPQLLESRRPFVVSRRRALQLPVPSVVWVRAWLLSFAFRPVERRQTLVRIKKQARPSVRCRCHSVICGASFGVSTKQTVLHNCKCLTARLFAGCRAHTLNRPRFDSLE